MAKLEGVRACVFDAYGTLFDVGSPVAKLASELGDKADALTKLWRQKQLEYYNARLHSRYCRFLPSLDGNIRSKWDVLVKLWLKYK